MHTCTQTHRTLASTSNINTPERSPLTISLACACVLVCLCACACVHMWCACVLVHVCLCMLVCLCMCACACLSTCKHHVWKCPRTKGFKQDNIDTAWNQAALLAEINNKKTHALQVWCKLISPQTTAHQACLTVLLQYDCTTHKCRHVETRCQGSCYPWNTQD